MVQKITDTGDWTFGIQNYIKDNDEILQNVVTRLRSFKNDWFLDLDAGLDWLYFLGEKNTKDEMIAAIQDTVINTEGVVKINSLEIVEQQRNAIIQLDITTIFSGSNNLEVMI